MNVHRARMLRFRSEPALVAGVGSGAERQAAVRDVLASIDPAVARRDAETLLMDLLGRDRAWLLAHPEAELTPVQMTGFRERLGRRGAGEPVQYITGRQEFFGLDLRVSPAVLIPRPETELLVEAVLAWARSSMDSAARVRVADVGTGSGAIALALAAHLPEAEVTALDLSPAALEVARENAVRLRVAERVRFFESDLLAAVQPEVRGGGPWDVIASNPPYVPEGDRAEMQPEVRDFEPHTALFAGTDGLDVYRRLIPQAEAALRPGGLLAMEFGFGQREALRELLAGWRVVRFLEDLAGIPRVVLAERF